MTNYERMKNMSIEEMAVTLMCPNAMGMADIKCSHEDERNCSRCCLEWLAAEEAATDDAREEKEGTMQTIAMALAKTMAWIAPCIAIGAWIAHRGTKPSKRVQRLALSGQLRRARHKEA